MREKEVEQKLVKAVKLAGGFCIKFTSPGFDGVPDRLVLLPKGRMAFIELKAPGKKPRALQKRSPFRNGTRKECDYLNGYI